jgi:hypothetical protein
MPNTGSFPFPSSILASDAAQPFEDSLYHPTTAISSPARVYSVRDDLGWTRTKWRADVAPNLTNSRHSIQFVAGEILAWVRVVGRYSMREGLEIATPIPSTVPQ